VNSYCHFPHFAISCYTIPTAGPVIAAGTWIVISLAALYIKRQIGGLTGDTYGAINEIALITVLLVINMLAFNHWLL